MGYQSFLEYWDDVRAQIINSKQTSLIGIRPSVNNKDKHKGLISGRIAFKNGATLEVTEAVNLDPLTGEAIPELYNFHFADKDQSFLFRYDMDIPASRNKQGKPIISHPPHHLHVVNRKDVRYITHRTNLIEIYNFIIETFINKPAS